MINFQRGAGASVVFLALTLAPTLLLPSTTAAQSYATGSGPYTQPYLQGPRRPLDGTPRDGVYSERPAPRYDTTRRNVGRDPRPPVFTPPAIWNGLYVGAQGGYRWSDSVVSGANFSNAWQGGLQAGGHFGYNVQVKQFVVGVESDLTVGSTSAASTNGGNSFLLRDGWTSTVRGRAGMVFGQALFYGTGGIAVTDRKLALNSPSSNASSDGLRAGYVFGGGIEYKFSPQISTRLEALHFAYTDTSLTWNSTAQNIKQDANVVRAGVSFHFN